MIFYNIDKAPNKTISLGIFCFLVGSNLNEGQPEGLVLLGLSESSKFVSFANIDKIDPIKLLVEDSVGNVIDISKALNKATEVGVMLHDAEFKEFRTFIVKNRYKAELYRYVDLETLVNNTKNAMPVQSA